jgi:UDP-N-acetylglucosamine 2-epimerase (non-hydrolysing)
MLRTPCVTVRRNTERTVTLEIGSNRLAGADRAEVTLALAEALESDTAWEWPERWDLEVARRCAEALAAGVIPPRGA